MSSVFQRYMGTGLVVILFLVAVVYLLRCEKRKPIRILLVYTPIVILLLFFNPFFYRVFSGALEDEIYFRVCWLLPMVVVISYSIISVCGKLQGMKRTGFALTALLIIIASGKWVYSNALFTRAENMYHVPQKVVDICDAIAIEGREVMAAFPTEFLLYVRQYSPLVCMPYGRIVDSWSFTEFYALMCQDEIEVDKLATMAKQELCHYIILPEDTVLLGNMEEYAYEMFAEMHGYVIYRDTTMNFEIN